MRFKQDRMSSQERMDALFNYRKPDRIPINMITVGFPCRNVGQTVATGYDDPEKYFQAMIWTAEQYDWDLIPEICPHVVLGSVDFGGGFRLPEGELEGALVITSFPVKTEGDIDNLRVPDPKKSGRIGKAMELSKLQEKHGLPVTFVSRSPFSVAANICSLEQFSKWMLKKPELCERLMMMAIDHIFNVLQYWTDTFGADQIFAFMSSPCESNQVISPRHFEKFALSYHVEYHRRLKSLGLKRFWFHICGEQNLNLPALAGASLWPHPSLLSFGHEVDLEEAAKFFPHDIIYGNVEPTVIQMGTPQQVYDLTKIAIEKGGKAPGGFVLSAGCELPPLSPPVNLFAMAKAVNDFGWYE